MHKVGIEASELSGVQGLDPNENSQPFIELESMKEYVNGSLGSKRSSMPFLIRLGYGFQEG